MGYFLRRTAQAGRKFNEVCNGTFRCGVVARSRRAERERHRLRKRRTTRRLRQHAWRRRRRPEWGMGDRTERTILSCQPMLLAQWSASMLVGAGLQLLPGSKQKAPCGAPPGLDRSSDVFPCGAARCSSGILRRLRGRASWGRTSASDAAWHPASKKYHLDQQCKKRGRQQIE
jgi:hypothetical protein